MKRLIPATAVLAVLVVVIVGQAAGIGSSTPTTPSASTPRWVTHVARYPGGLSGAVRAVYAARGQNGAVSASAKAGSKPDVAGANVQMNDDSNPPLPQNETAVAYNVTNPQIAVAAANDYVSGGVVVMRTSDSGRNWASTRITPQFRGTGDFCSGGDPGVAYSQRDHAFYISQLCFFRALPFSEVQVYKSVDNGADLDARPPGCACGSPTSTIRPGAVDRLDLQRQGAHRSRQHPEQPALRADLRHLHQVPHRSRTGPATTARSSSPTRTRSQPTTPCCRPGRTRPFSLTTPAVTAPVPRPTSSATRWSNERHARRRVRLRELQQLLRPAPALPEVDRRRTDVPDERGADRQGRAVRGLRRRRGFGHDPAHAFPRTEHAVAGLQPADRQAVVRLPEQRQPADLSGGHLLPDRPPTVDCTGRTRRSCQPTQSGQPARQRPVLPVGRIG